MPKTKTSDCSAMCSEGSLKCLGGIFKAGIVEAKAIPAEHNNGTKGNVARISLSDHHFDEPGQPKRDQVILWNSMPWGKKKCSHRACIDAAESKKQNRAVKKHTPVTFEACDDDPRADTQKDPRIKARKATGFPDKQLLQMRPDIDCDEEQDEERAVVKKHMHVTFEACDSHLQADTQRDPRIKGRKATGFPIKQHLQMQPDTDNEEQQEKVVVKKKMHVTFESSDSDLQADTQRDPRIRARKPTGYPDKQLLQMRPDTDSDEQQEKVVVKKKIRVTFEASDSDLQADTQRDPRIRGRKATGYPDKQLLQTQPESDSDEQRDEERAIVKKQIRVTFKASDGDLQADTQRDPRIRGRKATGYPDKQLLQMQPESDSDEQQDEERVVVKKKIHVTFEASDSDLRADTERNPRIRARKATGYPDKQLLQMQPESDIDEQHDEEVAVVKKHINVTLEACDDDLQAHTQRDPRIRARKATGYPDKHLLQMQPDNDTDEQQDEENAISPMQGCKAKAGFEQKQPHVLDCRRMGLAREARAHVSFDDDVNDKIDDTANVGDARVKTRKGTGFVTKTQLHILVESDSDGSEEASVHDLSDSILDEHHKETVDGSHLCTRVTKKSFAVTFDPDKHEESIDLSTKSCKDDKIKDQRATARKKTCFARSQAPRKIWHIEEDAQGDSKSDGRGQRSEDDKQGGHTASRVKSDHDMEVSMRSPQVNARKVTFDVNSDNEVHTSFYAISALSDDESFYRDEEVDELDLQTVSITPASQWWPGAGCMCCVSTKAALNRTEL